MVFAKNVVAHVVAHLIRGHVVVGESMASVPLSKQSVLCRGALVGRIRPSVDPILALLHSLHDHSVLHAFV